MDNQVLWLTFFWKQQVGWGTWLGEGSQWKTKERWSLKGGEGSHCSSAGVLHCNDPSASERLSLLPAHEMVFSLSFVNLMQKMEKITLSAAAKQSWGRKAVEFASENEILSRFGNRKNFAHLRMTLLNGAEKAAHFQGYCEDPRLSPSLLLLL